MGLFAWLESTGIATWVREADSVWAFPTVLTLHTFGLGILVGASAVIDLRLLGAGRSLTLPSLRPLFGLAWTGFWLNAVTGSLLFAADASARASSPLFLAKLLLVAAGVAVTMLVQRAVLGRDATFDVPANARVLALISLVVWTAAITAGRLLAYV